MNISEVKWSNINKEQLKYLFIDKELPDATIAKMFNVGKDQVTYKRKKFNISLKSCWYDAFRVRDKEKVEAINNESKNRVLTQDNLDKIAKAITHYAFRNGPVEDIHANNQLTQDDMKVLNKYMVNCIGGLIQMMLDGEWLKVEALIEAYKCYGSEWDEVDPDIAEINDIFELMCNVKENNSY